MVFHNTDPQPIIMQIAEKMIDKRLKNNFNDRVFDIITGTIVDHTATVTINFYKVRFRVRRTRTPVRHVSANVHDSVFKTFNKDYEQTISEVQVSFIIENEYLCNNPDAFQGLIAF